jgi:putative ABC transport system permease protein
LLCDGDIPRQESINYVAINKSFADSISSNNNSVIGTLLWLEIQSPVTYQNDDGQFVDDVFLFQGEVMIKAVFQELSFLNTPKIFYSLVALENLLSSYILEDISDLRNANTSCVELFDLLGSDHYLLNYGLNLFALDQDSIEKISMLSSLLEENESFIAIESPAMMIKQSYSQLSLATIYSMLVFVVIAFIGTCCIMGIGSYSNYVAKKKESAILSTLGASKRNIRSIFFSQSLFVSVSAGFVSIILAIMLTKLINPFLENNFMTKSLIKIPFNYFLGIPYGLIIFLLLISILMSFLFTSLPLSIYKGLSLADELRDN